MIYPRDNGLEGDILGPLSRPSTTSQLGEYESWVSGLYVGKL